MRRRELNRTADDSAAHEAAAKQIVTFRTGAEEYGLPIESVAEVVRPLRITALPRMPEFVEGVINLRGTIIPVIDLRRRFQAAGASEGRRKERMVIARGAVPEAQSGPSAGLLALVVDDVYEVRTVPVDRVEAAPEAALGANAEFIAGMVKDGERLIVLLDIPKLLTREERAELAEAGDGNA